MTKRQFFTSYLLSGRKDNVARMQEHQQDAGQADRREPASHQNEDLAVPFERSTGKIKAS